ncbi:hypothetical protein I3842_08G143200 [Carya illinoinensis]|uniref:Uncharacterized protein n=1 Tax=Carya illinoinensis TaxID=32201 RepID=A0A922EFR5_CARIL|nr:hypothetical protein I3842_08G143200 [Carya illinoinensis]
MPVHLLSVVHALKAVLSKICNLISNFFWGSSGGKSKHKWINWQWVCKPVREGGMGLRCLEEVQISLLMKFFWNLLTSNSLWVQYFKAKYVKHMHISLVGQQRGTWFWKGILHCLPRVLSNSKWQIQDGKLFFWHDNWTIRMRFRRLFHQFIAGWSCGCWFFSFIRWNFGLWFVCKFSS